VNLVEQLRVTPDVKAKVVINDRTGTVVIGHNVRLSRVALAHANLAIVTGESPMVSQPAPFSEGQTTVVPRTQVEVTEENRAINVLEDAATVGDLVQALNALGVTPRDLSAIFQQLKAVGALHAELEFN
jgi:flagellar P-ring protein precursor FlgI